MTDVKLAWFGNGADLEVGPLDLVVDDGLIPAVLVSLFSDARAEPDPDRPIAGQDLRGWALQDADDDYGSRLWLLDRSTLTAETVQRAREDARKALAWLVEDQVARSVEVAASSPAPGALFLEVTLTRGTSRRWAHLWRAMESVTFSGGGTLLSIRLEG